MTPHHIFAALSFTLAVAVCADVFADLRARFCATLHDRCDERAEGDSFLHGGTK